MSGVQQSDDLANTSRPPASSRSTSLGSPTFPSETEQADQLQARIDNQSNGFPSLQSHVEVTQPSSGPAPSSSIDLVANMTSGIAHPPQRFQLARTWQPPQYYVTLAAQILRQVTKGWTPHILSDQEMETERRRTEYRLARIRFLEANQQRLLPQRNPYLENWLFMARVDYRMHVCRIFRINDLPAEILGNIFRFVAWSAPDFNMGIQWRSTLTSVCRHWRNVAVNDVALWNVVWFRRFSQYELCFEYLERAGNSILDIKIHDTVGDPLTIEKTTSLITRLFQKLSNIRSLIIVVQDWDPALCILHSLIRVGEQGIPMIMERFELHRAGSAYVQVGSGYEPSFYIQPISLFGGAYLPSLRHLSTNGVHIDWESSVLVNLRTLDMRRMPLDKVPTLRRFRTILRSCPNLHKLVLDGAGPQWTMSSLRSIDDQAPVTLPHLAILALGDFSTDYGAYICTQFIAPNVLELNLMPIAGRDPSSFFSQLAGMTPSVRSLTFHSTLRAIIPEAHIAILKWLISMPLLAYLRIINMPENFLDLLLCDAEALSLAHNHATKKPICPKLEVLEFHYLPPVTEANLGHIPVWARFRAQLGCPLNKVFTGAETATAFGKDRLFQLGDDFENIGLIFRILPTAQKTREEQQILGQPLPT